MELTKTTFGHFELYSIHAGRFRLDGGAMFGVVPKNLWSRQLEPDEQNRIPMAMRCLLIKSQETGRVYLIDNGSGTKFDEKFKSIYDLDYSEYNLQASLEYHGFSTDDITDMVFTHLHFDHCGGSTYYDDNDELALTFPEANHWVTQTQWNNAINPNPREKASFLPENIEPLKQAKEDGILNVVEEGHSFEPGFEMLIVNGHSVGQQLPFLQAGQSKLAFAADLLPTAAHVPLPWVMGYDMCAIDTLEEKERILNQAVDENWYFFLEHDAFNEIMRVTKENGRFKAQTNLTLEDLD
jgi:glyoxylase-like metal-dependent hydrolase (beta-lactamase superfamily II)